ncbi:hypothetical protein Csa_004561, partial [Cucumis sativus]
MWDPQQSVQMQGGGPTLGFLAFAVAAVVEWPVGLWFLLPPSQGAPYHGASGYRRIPV